jgi:paraquat-inducible protein A
MRDTLRRHSDVPDRWLLTPLLLLALVFLVLGLWLPALSVEAVPWIEDEISVLDGALVLWDEGQYFLFAVIVVFSILFPALKIILGLWAWLWADLGVRTPLRLVRRIEQLGKWSMLDVFVIAIVVAALNISVITEVWVHEGIYLFTAAVVLSMVVMGRLEKIAVDLEERWRQHREGL